MQDGTPFAPQFIENKLKYSPFIREAVCFGNERPYVVAMVAIDMNTVGSWAERRASPYTSCHGSRPEVGGPEPPRGGDRQGQCDPAGVRAASAGCLLLTKDLEADDAEMTRTRKVRRRFVAEKYAPVIEAFYGGAGEVELSTSITYEDGRQAAIRSRVHIEDVERDPPMSDDARLLPAAHVQRRHASA